MNSTILYQELHRFVAAVFSKMGCSEIDSEKASEVLLSADLRGIDSHGIARLPGYVRLWEKERINTRPDYKIVRESLSTATLDADKSLGLTAAPYAMEIAMNKAETAGTGWVTVKNSNHFGIAGIHAMMALDRGMIGIAMTNASPIVVPTFGAERMLGTNPIAVAIPAGKERPFIADFATTTASNGKLEILQRLGEDAPAGWVLDKEGDPSHDAGIIKSGGMLLPLGGDRIHGSHKGYALGSIVDIFSGVMSGASFGPWAPPFPAYIPMPSNMPGEGLGHFFGAIKIDAFMDENDFYDAMDKWIRRFSETKPKNPAIPVLVPGDPERECEIERRQKGIPLHTEVMGELKKLSERFNIPLPD